MNAFEIEEQRQNLLIDIPVTHGKSKIFLFYNYYSSILNSSEISIVEAYSLEFIEEYINLLQHYSPFCLPPERTASIIKQFRKILELSSIDNFKQQIVKEIERLELQLKQLESILFGNKNDEQNIHMLSFPLIEESATNTGEVLGFLETVRITVTKSKVGNKLYVFPNTGELEKKLEQQIKNSFLLSLRYLENYKKKFHQFHEITIYFDNFSANYIGNSLGIALTVGFIEQLSILYNLPFLVNIRNNISSTGGINEDGTILPVEKEFIEKKVEIVFYSSIDIFIIPKADEPFANEKLTTLKNSYPQRNLKIIGVTDLNDILDRRNLINISKQNPVVRSVKASVRNWQVTLLIAILYVIITITLVRNFDDNPNILDNLGNVVYVKNKSGRVLWTKQIDNSGLLNDAKPNLKSIQRIVDINNDGTNEVILCSKSTDELNSPNVYEKITCYNSEGNIIWSYGMQDSLIDSENSTHPVYATSLIDTFSLKNKKFLLAMASDRTSSNSLIFSLNLKNGKLKGGILQHKGMINNALIYDFNNDGVKEVAFSTINSDLMRPAFADINLDNISGRCPTGNAYENDNDSCAKLNSYIVLPGINGNQTKGLNSQIKLKEMINIPAEHCLYLSFTDTKNPDSIINFKIHYDWQKIDIDTRRWINGFENGNSATRVQNNNEFAQLLNNEIMYWNGKNFVLKNKP